MLNIKILGSGCASCKKLEAVAREAAQNLNIQAEFEKITDMRKMMTYDILATPALVINEKVVSSGKIPTIADVQSWISAMQ
ncbi:MULTISPECIES: thioredoxin family protein [Pseudomonas]|jgi:small redox-active disulfide protein 2|uniref:thioredoxin family protein n=1 Tax=Pseudomonas sp. MIL9 TaxID=2807620 RepID=UPI00102A4F3A|nr:thioredoxin family protein [Pseudomonas sp. MIL9]MBM6446781.1 TM0996/MTH895 family glutaredoxin-like protein [Pseudomonas sp. MIL9]RZO05624.1 thioredoxin family protein [Pseudomonas moorei]